MQAPQTVNWLAGSTHTLDLNSAKFIGVGEMAFTWSDGGSATNPIVTPSAAKSFTAYFVAQSQVKRHFESRAGWSGHDESPGIGWCCLAIDNGSDDREPYPGVRLRGIQRQRPGASTATTSFVMGAAPRSVAATFSCPASAGKRHVARPAGLNVKIDGATSVSPADPVHGIPGRSIRCKR